MVIRSEPHRLAAYKRLLRRCTTGLRVPLPLLWGLRGAGGTAVEEVYEPVVADTGVSGDIIAPSLYVDTDIFGSHTVTSLYTITPTLFTDGDTFGTHTVASSYTITTTIHLDTDTFGTHAVTSAATIAPTALAVDDTFGTHVLTLGYTIAPTLHTDTDAFGTHTVASLYTITPSRYDETDTFGTALITINQFITPALYGHDDEIYAGAGYPAMTVANDSVVTGGDFTVSGSAVMDRFTHPGVIYPYAPVERRTN
jgi:hypothetical protein